MKNAMRALGGIGLCLLLALMLPGCQRAKHRVLGKVTREGQPLEWKTEASKELSLLVLFVPFDRERDQNIYRADTDFQTGTYAVTVPAGKYRISVQQMDPDPRYDLLGFTYSIKESPIIREVTGPGEMNIDLPRELPN